MQFNKRAVVFSNVPCVLQLKILQDPKKNYFWERDIAITNNPQY
jgi:hypothetical protein